MAVKASGTLSSLVTSKYFQSINYIILTFLIPEMKAFSHLRSGELRHDLFKKPVQI